MTLIVLPNLLNEEADPDLFFPKKLKDIIHSLNGLIAEDEKNGRKFLKRFYANDDWKKIKIEVLNEHSDRVIIFELIKQIKNNRWGIISDAGLCCIADPGSELIYEAKKESINIEVISGPSSIFFALILSGLHSQRFSFQGYLPREENELIKKNKTFGKTIKSRKNYSNIYRSAI